MDPTLQADLQAVADKNQADFKVTFPAPPVPQPQDEVVEFTHQTV